MANQAATLATLSRHIALALAPLREYFATLEAADNYLGGMLGIDLQLTNADLTLLTEISIEADTLYSAAEAIAAQLEQNDVDAALLVQETLALFTAISTLLELADDLRVRLETISAGQAVDEQVLNEFKTRLIAYLLIDYLESHFPLPLAALESLGLARRKFIQTATDPIRGYVKKSLHLERLATLITDPMGLLAEVYGWGTTDGIEIELILDKLEIILRTLSIPVGIVHPTTPGGLPELRTYSLTLNANPARSELVATVDIDFMAGYKLPVPFPSERWGLTLEMESGLESGAALTIKPPLDVELIPPQGTAWGNFQLRLATRDDFVVEAPLQLIGLPGGSRLEVDDISASIGGNLMWDSSSSAAHTDLYTEIVFSGCRFVLELGQADNFIASIFPAGGADSAFDFAVGISADQGLFIPNGVGFVKTFSLQKVIGPLTLETLDLAVTSQDNTPSVELRLSGNIDLAPFVLTVDQIGLGLNIDLTATQPNLGLFDLTVDFLPPKGIGVAIDVEVVSGGGFLDIDAEAGSYDGVLDLELLEVGITAVAIIDTKLPDVDGWSMFFALFLDLPSIQLGFGFTLEGVGGVAGVNRAIDVDALGSAVRSGSLDTILFPEDPIADAPIIIDAFRSIFPAADDSYVFGPVVKIGWGTPTLIEAQLGIVIQLPDPIVIVVLGSLSAILPTKEAELVALNLDVAGVIDFEAGSLSIDASLHDSHVVGFALSGDMALRAEFANAQAFLMSVGGFHPRFDPPGDFPDLRRLSFGISAGSILRIDFQSYFALTSNSVQCGASFVLDADVLGFGVYGSSAFDALVQFSPFVVITSVDFEVSIKAAGIDLVGVMLHASVEGPNRWHVIGTATFEVLGLEKDIRVDELIGPRENEPPVEAPNLLEDLVAALESEDAWQVIAGNDAAVTLVDITDPTAGLLAIPDARIEVRQTLVPLGLEIEQFGNAPIGNDSLFDLAIGTSDETDWLEDWFAPAQFFELSKADKLEGPEFEKMRSGLQFGGGAPVAGPNVVVETGYKPYILDPEQPEADTPSRFTAVLHAEAGAPLTTRTGSGFTAVYEETVATAESVYVLVDEAGETVMQSSTWSAAYSAGSGRADLHVERQLTEVGP